MAAVRPLEPEADLPRLVELWNAQVCALPLSQPVTLRQMALELDVAADASAEREEGPYGHVRALEQRRVWVADGSDGLLGFCDCGVDPAHTGRGRQSLGSPVLVQPARAMIRWLWYKPGQRRVGEALLDAAEAHLRQQGVEDVLAFDDEQTYGFYHVGHAFLSDRANHIHALLEARGYARYESELFFEWRDYTAADLLALLPPDTESARPSVEALCPAGLTVSFEAIEGRGARPNGTLRIHDAEDELVGICECLSAGERSESPAAQDWMLVSWLGVPPSPTVEAYSNHASQGRGLGKYALVAAMEAMLTLGYRHATISTRGIATAQAPDDANSRAQLFYANFGGFGVADFTYGLSRSLQPSPAL